MSEAAATATRSTWIALTPIAVIAGAALAPHVSAPERAAAALTFGGGVFASTGPLALAAASTLRVRGLLALGAASVAVLVVAALVGAHGVGAAAAVDAGLVAFAHAAGGGIGRRVQHPGHLFPACFVAAAADLASALHPSGPTHAVMRSERALSVLAIAFPVPGAHALAPVLGVGDLLFLALVFGAIVAHRLSLARAFGAALVALGTAGALSAWLGTPVPALVPVAVAICLGVPETRRVRPEDRRVTSIAIAVAIAVALGIVLQRWLA